MIRKPGNGCTKKEFNTYKLEKVCMFSGLLGGLQAGIPRGSGYSPKDICTYKNQTEVGHDASIKLALYS